MSDRPAFTITEAAKACGVSSKTIRRRLAADAFPAAHRLDGPAGIASGPWSIPVADLLAAGLQVGKPTPPDQPTPEPAPMSADVAELDRLKLEVAELRRRAEVAEAIAQERERTIETQAQALRMLEAAPAPPAPSTPPDTPDARTERPRRWWKREKRP